MSRLLRLRTPILRLPSRASSTFSRGPAPPRLPADQQAEFERLQRAASVSSAFQEYANPPSSTSEPAATSTSSEAAATPATAEAQPQEKPVNPTISASEEDTMHPAYVRGAPPEFEGDVNPRTGEVGGPKREPLRWGSGGDWSYNGRVTDF
ncbi:Succinate dehydrogenase assembly factor 4 [Colletotrichum gloeosporioides]|uniref:Succinate dehydrogenase assembly factor 4, mitochondrial n=1 Tax=Colletotrichum gloeosporioides TaxID=474922 RepID=A0A8H4CD21_COLGL|nr:Succinate dehydrogenase assembly factor 4 [Colletotrichum gloeosporioides]KAF3801541.1 Succinate dehydrogenase assembly factor 4 [Colletotrichum gloeosporioides]